MPGFAPDRLSEGRPAALPREPASRRTGRRHPERALRKVVEGGKIVLSPETVKTFLAETGEAGRTRERYWVPWPRVAGQPNRSVLGRRSTACREWPCRTSWVPLPRVAGQPNRCVLGRTSRACREWPCRTIRRPAVPGWPSRSFPARVRNPRAGRRGTCRTRPSRRSRARSG